MHDVEEPKDALERIIKEAAAHNSAILIPAFAVGRAQEIVYLIRELEDEKRIPILPVSVDSPMAAAATQAYARPTEEHDEDYADALKITPTPLRTHSMIPTVTREESKRLNEAKGARVIIAASGMMNGGRVLHHALRLLPDENATVVFVGYQAAGTLGRRVADGEKEVKVLGQWIPVRCKIEKIGGFSAHADWKEVVRWLEEMPRRRAACSSLTASPMRRKRWPVTFAIDLVGRLKCRSMARSLSWRITSRIWPKSFRELKVASTAIDGTTDHVQTSFLTV